MVPFEATVFREGHDVLGVRLLLSDPTGVEQSFTMAPGAPGTDSWVASAQVGSVGTWTWRIRAFSDEWRTWQHNAQVKVPAGIDVDLMFLTAQELLRGAHDSAIVRDARAAASDASLTPLEKLAALSAPELSDELDAHPLVGVETISDPVPLRVERSRAAIGSWYEFFPRSEGAKRAKDGTWKSGTFRTAAKRLPAVAAMGFDVIYLPPIHPIGATFRKGRNNSVTAEPGDPGSPYAIGSADGGHDAIHKDLGGFDDFRFFVRSAKKNGMEVALDIALNASPDHPWVTEHPEWFTKRADGTIAYSENPPKKYQDIYNFNFDADPEGIYQAFLAMFELWIAQGVTLFRVDNPHTKPVAFWERILNEVNGAHPEIVFLSEAFTRPAMMETLAGAGFQQSYTYFTWRNTKQELSQFFTDITTRTASFMRPNMFVNTHDILTEYLQFGGRGAYKVRAALAATASPSWGVYAGYELIENVARPGSEENIDNEKYEYKQRDWAAADAAGTTIAPYLTRLNLIRAAHPSLRQLRNLDVQWTDDESILAYSKFLPAQYTGTGSPDGLIIVANLDSHAVRETVVHLDLTRLGLGSDDSMDVVDLITGDSFTWGRDNYVRLDPFTQPVHILRVAYPKGN